MQSHLCRLLRNRFPQPETSSPFLKVMIQHDNDLMGPPKSHRGWLAVCLKSIHIYPISISIWNRVLVQRCNWRISQQLGWIRHQLAGRIIPTGWLQGRCLLSTGHVLVDKEMVGGSDQWLAYNDPIDMPGIPHAVFFRQSDDYPGSKRNSNHENPWNHKFFQEI